MSTGLFPDVLAVRGEGEVRVVPDAAALSVRVQVEAPVPADAARLAAEVATVVDGLLDRLGAALRSRRTTGLVLAPEYEWTGRRRRRTGYRAARDSALEVTDPGMLGPLLADLAERDEVALSGPTWLVDPGNPARSAARTAAAADARARAEAYASGLGVTVGPVVWAAEPGLRAAGDPVGGGVLADRAVHLNALEAGPTLDVEPGEQTVRAVLEVGYRLLG